MSEKKRSANQSEMEEPKARTSGREARSAKASTRDEGKSKPVRRDVRATSVSAKKSEGFANRPVVRFVREAYRELRYKVTWPTLQEARNMTIAVLALSLVVGLILGLVDAGLFQLFKLVTGK